MKKTAGFFMLVILFLASQEASALRIERLVMPGDLIQGHKKFEDACEKCHVKYDKVGQTQLCRACHEEIDLDILKKNGFHGGSLIRDRACTDCHTDHEGRNANIVLFDAGTFNHDQTEFVLQGKHKDLLCDDCHQADQKYREAGVECYDCHKEEDPHKKLLGRECSECHNEKNWHETDFDHEATDFPLMYKHKDVACESCHPANVSKKISQNCIACHRINDVHGGRYGKVCSDCHKARGWRKIVFDHDKETEFPLQYSHAKVSCDACHSGDIYKDKLKTDCYSCHKHNDIHLGQYGKKCQSCHKPYNWNKVRFDHDKTDFRLKGKHGDVKCNRCHSGNLYDEDLQTNCFGCHSRDDVHEENEGEKCEDCHNESGWNKGVLFNHDMTSFPLVGLHAVTPCEECHLSQDFKEADLVCNKCHEKDDIHKKKLGIDCKLCHNPNGWKIWQFEHNKQTDYILDGKHEGLDCHACHTEPQLEISLGSKCMDCHEKDDVHAGNFTSYCERCHVTSSFKDITLVR